jgi:hypothetical protein
MATIAAATGACLHGFSELELCHPDHAIAEGRSTAEGITIRFKAMPLDKLQKQHTRLKIWSGNLGATHTGRNSLDFRLRESNVMWTNMLRLLGRLEQALAKSMYCAPVLNRRIPEPTPH